MVTKLQTHYVILERVPVGIAGKPNDLSILRLYPYGCNYQQLTACNSAIVNDSLGPSLVLKTDICLKITVIKYR